MKKIILALILPLIILISSCEIKNINQDYISHSLFAMDTFINISYESDNEKLSAEVSDLLYGYEKMLSRKLEDSEIFKLNNNSDLELSEEALHITSFALNFAKETDGMFNPCLGNITDLWDVTGEGYVPSQDEIDAVLESCDYTSVTVSENIISPFI